MVVKTNQIVNIQAYKHDGALYRQWNGAKIIESSQELLVVLMNKTKVIEQKGQRWIVREPKIWFFPIGKFFNTVALIRKRGIFYYTNVASSPIFEDNTIKFIDYDIDIKAYPQQKTRVVDQREYEINQSQFRYSEKLVKKITTTTNEILRIIKMKDHHFNYNVVNNYLQKLVETKDLAPKFLKNRTRK